MGASTDMRYLGTYGRRGITVSSEKIRLLALRQVVREAHQAVRTGIDSRQYLDKCEPYLDTLRQTRLNSL